MSFTFKCPKCNIELEAQDDWEGMTTPCPSCQADITISRKMPSAEAQIQAAEKACPFCGEKIKLQASLCRYCHRELPQGGVQRPENAALQSDAAPAVQNASAKNFTTLYVLLALFLVALGVCFLFPNYVDILSVLKKLDVKITSSMSTWLFCLYGLICWGIRIGYAILFACLLGQFWKIAKGKYYPIWKFFIPFYNLFCFFDFARKIAAGRNEQGQESKNPGIIGLTIGCLFTRIVLILISSIWFVRYWILMRDYFEYLMKHISFESLLPPIFYCISFFIGFFRITDGMNLWGSIARAAVFRQSSLRHLSTFNIGLWAANDVFAVVSVLCQLLLIVVLFLHVRKISKQG